MNDIQQIFREVIGQAMELRIPISDKLYYKVRINSRAKARYGMCSFKNGEYIIEVSDALFDAPEIFCKSTLAHEILHTCGGCMNHQKKWKQYAKLMNDTFGYRISVKAPPLDGEAGGKLKNCAKARYAVKCLTCGKEYTRYKKSKLITNPQKFRCGVCGGVLGQAYGVSIGTDEGDDRI